MTADDITADRVRSLFIYDPETGAFTNRVRRSTRLAGMRADFDNGRYRQMYIDGYRPMAHRVAWLYMTGAWPSHEIDHVDGNKQNNSFANLRDVPHSTNVQNRRDAFRNSKSGYLGVHRMPKSKANPWQAQIKLPHGKRIHLGSFPTPEAAHEAYMAAKALYHPGALADE